MIKYCLSFLIVLSLFQSFFWCPALAQTPSSAPTNIGVDVANVYDIKDTTVENGDLMRNGGDGIRKATSAYDDKIFGIYQQNPLIVLRNVDGTGQPIIRNGETTLNVSTITGAIKKGDFITSSPISGKGQKAIESGYIVGMALEDFDPSNSATKIIRKETFEGKEYSIGQIKVAIRIEYAEINRARSANRLFQYIDAAMFSSVKNPEQFIRIIRYSGSVIVLIATAAFAYLVFARSVGNGIQAIGRNPLARKSIQVAIVLNIVFSTVIILLGIVAAFVILRA